MVLGEKKDESSTPKLHLYNTFPSKTKEPIGMVTPPLHSFVSIPFEWEEAPGKPRSMTNDQRSKSKTVRCLVPPPRLMSCNNTSKIASMPSPTTVLDGPNTGDLSSSLSSSSSSMLWSKSFSLSSRRSFRGEGEEKSGERFRFTYWRKGSSSNEKKGNGSEGVEHMDFSHGIDRKSKKGIKRRSSSFLSLSSTSSNLWGSIYGNLKQAVPWKRMPEKPTKATATS